MHRPVQMASSTPLLAWWANCRGVKCASVGAHSQRTCMWAVTNVPPISRLCFSACTLHTEQSKRDCSHRCVSVFTLCPSGGGKLAEPFGPPPCWVCGSHTERRGGIKTEQRRLQQAAWEGLVTICRLISLSFGH